MCSGLGLYGQIEQRNPLSHRHVDLTKTLPYTSPIPITNNTHNRTTIPYCTYNTPLYYLFIISDNDVSSHVSDRRRRPLIMQHLHCLHITYSAYREVLNIFVAIGSDIIETIVNPGLDELAQVGGIVLIRTVLAFFLNREIDANQGKA